MKERISNSGLLLAIIKKDIRVYSRNMIYLFLTVLGLVFFIAIFWMVPDEVDEEITFAISPSLDVLISEGKKLLEEAGLPAEIINQLEEAKTAFEGEGLVLVEFDNEEQLKQAIRGELEVYKTEQQHYLFHDPESDQDEPEDADRIQLGIGMSLPPAFLGDAVLGESQTVTFYTDADVPEELRNAMQGMIREIAYHLAGHDLPVELPDEEVIILGTDRLGEQITMRDRMRPMVAFFIMMMETFAMASLISNEVLQRTVTALLVTPVRVGHFLLAKTIFGTALAMSQAVIILLLVGAFTVENWSLLLVTVLLGSVLFTAVAMFVGAAGKDFIGQLMFSMLFIIPLMIPSFAVLFPGSVATWVSYLPSYPIVRLLYDITVYDLLWADSLYHLAYAVIWVVVIYAAGLVVLKRKVAAL